MSDEIAALSLTAVADAIRTRRVSAREVTELAIARIERAQPRLNCFLSLNAEAALEAAKRADAELARGPVRSPLHGVPLAHKDLFYRDGRVASCGSAIRRDFVPATTASVLERLDALGAIDLGTLNMSEFALGPAGHNAHFGDCRNPWNPERIAGGSSSGSAAATAARLIYGALGSDTAGSIRLPAACCGLVGLKPTHTRVSRHGVMPLSFSLDCVGPLTRTVRDCARLAGIIAGADVADPTCSLEPVPDYEAGLNTGVKGLRIGVPANYFYDEVTEKSALEQSLEVYRSLGAEPVAMEVPEPARLNDLAAIVQGAEAATIHARWMRTRPEDYSAEVRGRLEAGYHLSATQYLEASRLRAPLLREFVKSVFERVDIFHAPVMAGAAPGLDETRFGAAPDFPALIAAMIRCTRPISYLGLPALSVPCGFSADGMPLGFQLVGPPFSEALLLRAGHAYQQATDWHEAAPPD